MKSESGKIARAREGDDFILVILGLIVLELLAVVMIGELRENYMRDDPGYQCSFGSGCEIPASAPDDDDAAGPPSPSAQP